MAICTDSEYLIALGISSPTASQTSLFDQLKTKVERAVQDYLGFTVSTNTYTEYLPEEDLVLPEDPLFMGYELSSAGQAVPVRQRGMGQEVLVASRTPIREVTSLYENLSAWETAGGSWPAESELTEGPDFYVDWNEPGLCWSGRILRQTGSWLGSRRTVKLTYVAGLTADELSDEYETIKTVCLLEMVRMWNQNRMNQPSASGAPPGPVTSFSLDGFSQSYDAATAAALFGLKVALSDAAKEMLAQFVRVGKYWR